jgi:hypothetical protein
MEKGFFPEGSSILPNQSKTVSLLQLSVPQVPLLLHPRGAPFPLLAHEAQPIVLFYRLKIRLFQRKGKTHFPKLLFKF